MRNPILCQTLEVVSGTQKLEYGCGEEVVVPCGATLPTCKKPCPRTHACDHKGSFKQIISGAAIILNGFLSDPYMS